MQEVHRTNQRRSILTLKGEQIQTNQNYFMEYDHTPQIQAVDNSQHQADETLCGITLIRFSLDHKLQVECQVL